MLDVTGVGRRWTEVAGVPRDRAFSPAGIQTGIESLWANVGRAGSVATRVVIHVRPVVGILRLVEVAWGGPHELEAAKRFQGLTFDVAAEGQVNQGIGTAVQVSQQHYNGECITCWDKREIMNKIRKIG